VSIHQGVVLATFRRAGAVQRLWRLAAGPLTPDTRVQSEALPCRICGGQSGTGTGFRPSTSASPVSNT
jgi:hypothetical protein